MARKTEQNAVSESRRNYLKGLGAAVSLSGAATSGTAGASDASRFTSDLGEIGDAMLSAVTGDAIVVERDSAPVAPGVERRSFTRLTERGWLECDLLSVALDEESNDAVLLSPGVTSRETVSNLADAEGAVAGVNGDFFDIGNTDAPVGAEIGAGRLRSSPAPGRENAVAVGRDGLVRIARVALDGRVGLPDGNHRIAALNQPSIPADGIGLYTSLWGDAARLGAVEVFVPDGVVASEPSPVGDGAVPEGTSALVGRGAGADALSALSKGDSVSIGYAPKTDAGSPLDAPSSVAVDEMATVSATSVQTGGLAFPLEYPATVRWSGSSNLFVRDEGGDEREEDRYDGHDEDDRDDGDDYVAAFDPETGELTGLRPGTVTLRVTSNGVTGETTVTVRD